MDTEDDPTAYLKFLNDNPGNYLLHSNDELQDALPVEPIFTEIDTSVWPSQGFPILLNGALITEDQVDANNITNDNEIFEDEEVSENIVGGKVPVGVFNETVVSDGISSDTQNVYLPNDILLHLTTQVINQQNTSDKIINNKQDKNIYLQSNGTTYAITFSPNQSENQLVDQNINNEVVQELNNEVIQLLNSDGTYVTIDKSLLSSLDNFEKPSQEDQIQYDKKYDDFFESITAHKCKVCSFICESVDAIKEHLDQMHSELVTIARNVSGGDETKGNEVKLMSILNTNTSAQKKITVFVCSKCYNMFASKELLKEHMITEHKLTVEPQNGEHSKKDEKTVNPNENKNKSSTMSKQELAAALIKKQQKAMKKVKCSIKGCSLRFAKDELRIRHEECHVNENKKLFQCPECKENFSIWRICSKHLWQCHKIDMGLLTCPMCNEFKSVSPVVVINHMNIHNEEKPFLCSKCGKGFKQLTQLRNHYVVHKNPDEWPNWSISRQCSICERFFSNSKCLKKHVQSVHDKFKPFICNICGHQAARKAMLELHLRQHTGDKPHQCTHCDYRTGDHNCLRRHLMRHSGGVQYLCPHCSYTSIQSASYKNHLTSKHPGSGGTFECTYCSYTTVNALSYFAHIKSHELMAKRAETNNTAEGSSSQGNPNGNEAPSESISKDGKTAADTDDESQSFSLLSDHTDLSEEIVDKGGFTIPAGLETQLSS